MNSFESKIAGVLVTGIDSGAARSVVLVGEIPGYPFESYSETGRVYTSATGDRVFHRVKQQILGTVDGKVRGLTMRVKSRVSRVCTTCVLPDIVSCSTSTATRGPESRRNQADWREDPLQVANRVWELEVKIIPKVEAEDILTKMQQQNVEELCLFEEQVLWP